MTDSQNNRNELQNATRNDHRTMINNIWSLIDRLELSEEEQNEINTNMAWITEDLI